MLPDPHALARWIAAAQRGASHREIAGEIVRSEGYCQTQIEALYRSLLDREGEPAELAAWTRSLGSGVALQDVIAALCDSGEYKANHAGSEAFVEALYQRLLRRASDPEGKAAWLTALDQRASTLSVIRGMLCSTEYCAQRATELHERLVGREPQPGELSDRILELMHGTPLQKLVLRAVTSAEYIARARTRSAELAAAAPAVDPEELAPADEPAPPRSTDPDAEVLALVRNDERRAALARLMESHGPAVYRYCCMAVSDPVLADDIHQQVFLEAFRDLPRFAGRSTLRSWLIGIAHHRVLDAARRRHRTWSRTVDTEVVDTPDPRPSLDESFGDAELQAALVACIAKLDEPARSGVLMRYQQGLSYEEMARICGEKPGTLQARVARALRRLRGLIEEHLAD